MTLWIDHKYAGLLSANLELFKRKDSKVYNFRCPVCGDSKKNRFKARGYLMEKEDRMIYYCHNCGASMSMYDFVQTVNTEIHKQYVLEVYQEKNSTEKRRKIDFKPDISKFVKPKYMKSPLGKLKKVSQLHVDHKAKQYIVQRRIPTRYHAKLFYAPKFCAWINTIVKNKFDEKALALDDERIIIPFIDEEGTVFGVQGRALSDSYLRYITIMFDDSKTKIFGLDTVDFKKSVYITEGPIDSMFIPNSLAMAGSDGDLTEYNASDLVFVYDNEPRNKEIVSKVEKQIDKGNKVVIWPDHFPYKDINDCIIGGLDVSDVMQVIESNTYQDLAAKFRLSKWRKV
jgi:transcription elongation factor Elf1